MAQVLPQELPRCSHIMFLQTNDSEEFSSSFAMVSNCDASLSDLATPGTMDLLIWAVEKNCLIMLCCGSLLSVFQCRIHIFRIGAAVWSVNLGSFWGERDSRGSLFGLRPVVFRTFPEMETYMNFDQWFLNECIFS
jgi:hypothetical protein